MARVRISTEQLEIVLNEAADENSDLYREQYEDIVRQTEATNNVMIAREFAGRVPHVNIMRGKRSKPYFGRTQTFPRNLDWRQGVRLMWAANLAIAREAMKVFRAISPYDASDNVHYRDSFVLWDGNTTGGGFAPLTPNMKVDPIDTIRITNIQPYARRLDRFGDRTALSVPSGIFYVTKAALDRKYRSLAEIRVSFPRFQFWVRGQGSYLQAQEPGPVQHPVLNIIPKI